MNKKLKYWLYVLLSGLVGGLAGFFTSYWTDKPGENGFAQEWNWQLYIVFPYDIVFFVFAVSSVVLLILLLVGMARLRTHATQANDEDLYSPAELAVSKLMIRAGLLQSISAVWVATASVYPFDMSESVTLFFSILTFMAAGFLIVSWLIVRRVIHKMNELSPRLAIDLYDHKGDHLKDYEQRLDESERLQMYKAGFVAMRSTLSFIMIAGFALFIYSLFFQPQLNVLLALGVVYVFMQFKYFQVSSEMVRHSSKGPKHNVVLNKEGV